jgi:hypothetical protein
LGAQAEGPLCKSPQPFCSLVFILLPVRDPILKTFSHQDLEQKLEVKQRELEALAHNPASAPTEDVQSSNDSDGPRTMAGASPSREEEAQSKPRGPRNMHLMKSFDNPLSELSPEQSPNSPERRLSVSKPGRLYESRLLDESVYPSPNGVLENHSRRQSSECLKCCFTGVLVV